MAQAVHRAVAIDRERSREFGTVFSDSDQLSFPKKPRLLNEARVATVRPVVDDAGRFNGEHSVLAFVGSKEVDVRYVETSGEFQLIADEQVQALSRTDLRDLANAIRRYQETVPWDDGVAGRVLVGLNERIFPTCLSSFTMRSVSDLGEVVLLAGHAGALEIDVVLQLASSEVTLLITQRGAAAQKRLPTTQEAQELALVLEKLVDGQPITKKLVLVALVLESLRRRAVH